MPCGLCCLGSPSGRCRRRGPCGLGGRAVEGLHLTADLYQCNCSRELLIDAERLAELCRRHTLGVGLTLVDEKWFTFPDHQGEPGGVTGMLLLAESHLAVHTWPERNGVTLDVYVCNYSADNSGKAERLMAELLADLSPAVPSPTACSGAVWTPARHPRWCWSISTSTASMATGPASGWTRGAPSTSCWRCSTPHSSASSCAWTATS